MKKKTSKKTPTNDPLDDIKKHVVIGKLSPEQYWRWRLTIEELETAKLKAENAQLKCSIKVLEVEKSNLQLLLLRKSYQEKQSLVEQAKTEYDKIKTDIEHDLSISLSGCTINEHTFEVQKID